MDQPMPDEPIAVTGNPRRRQTQVLINSLEVVAYHARREILENPDQCYRRFLRHMERFLRRLQMAATFDIIN